MNNNNYYIYCWFCKEWGDIPFYVGKGHGDRYCSVCNRGQAFKAITSRWTCYSLIMEDELSEEEACEREDIWKRILIFDYGYPIMDGEGHSQALKNLAIKRVKERLRKDNPNYKDGRPPVTLPRAEIEKFRKMQKDHIMTADQICTELHISRATWYKLLKAA